MRIGVIGLGNISGIYLDNLARWEETKVVACADLDRARAEAAAAKRGVRAMDVDELLAHPDIDLVLNLTVPKAHHEVSLAALEAGKHVYSEKPLATTVADGEELMAAARSRGLTVGCAPDTVLGGAVQTCRKILDDGAIGFPVGANAFMLCPGHEGWHPSPQFYYETGGGPLLDMGPYYLSAFVTLFGPIRSVCASARTTWPVRAVRNGPHEGENFPVETPTHVSCLFQFANEAQVQFTASFDVQRSTLPPIEVYGSEGTILVPDPNSFGADGKGGDLPIGLAIRGGEWTEAPYSHGYRENFRGLGVLDQVRAIQDGRPLRASGELALHDLEAMESALLAAESGRTWTLRSTVARPEAMPLPA